MCLRLLQEYILWNGRNSAIVENIFLLIIVSEVGQTYQQNGRKLQAMVFLSENNILQAFRHGIEVGKM